MSDVRKGDVPLGGVRKGAAWGRPTTAPAEIVVDGDDAALADAVRRSPSTARIAWAAAPSSDFARAVGATSGGHTETPYELPCDAFSWSTSTLSPTAIVADLSPPCAVNMAVLGTAPDRVTRRSRSAAVRVVVDERIVHDGAATCVIVANGQYLRGADVVPRGHPGDGRLEIQVYAVPPAERRGLRERVRTGSHLPHPGIRQVTGHNVQITTLDADRRCRLEIDGVALAPTATLVASVRPRSFILVT